MSTPPQASFINLPERLKTHHTPWSYLKWQLLCELRVAVPGVIQSFDADTQTVTVQPSIRERVNNPSTLQPQDVDLPQLLKVPIVLPRAGGFVITFPIQQGDECLVIFGDNCIDSWWQSGGTQNAQLDRRRHDLSDGFAILAPWSQPNKIMDYSTDSMIIGTEDGSVQIELGTETVTITAPTININGSGHINVSGGVVSLTGSEVAIEGHEFLAHTHSGVTTGSGTSGPVTP